MKKITIPISFGQPSTKISINGKDYMLETGKEIEVEDFVADFIEDAVNASAAEPAKPYYEDLRVIKEFDFANDADEYSIINYDWFDFRPNKTYVLEVNGTMIDIVTETEYGSGYGKYSGKLFGYDFSITSTNARCKAPWKVKLLEKVAHPVLDKPYITVFVRTPEGDQPHTAEEMCAYIDPEMTIRATRAYVMEAVKAGKTIVGVIDGEREFVASLWDGIDYIVISGTEEWFAAG